MQYVFSSSTSCVWETRIVLNFPFASADSSYGRHANSRSHVARTSLQAASRLTSAPPARPPLLLQPAQPPTSLSFPHNYGCLRTCLTGASRKWIVTYDQAGPLVRYQVTSGLLSFRYDLIDRLSLPSTASHSLIDRLSLPLTPFRYDLIDRLSLPFGPLSP